MIFRIMMYLFRKIVYMEVRQMYQNLNAELARINMTRRELAKRLGRSPTTLSTKLNGKAPLQFKEAVHIKEIIGTTIPLEELFQ